MFRFAAEDFGLPGGGPAFILVPVGVLGADSVGGARFERIRIGAFVGGSVLRSIAEAERSGGGPAEGCDLELDMPGEAV